MTIDNNNDSNNVNQSFHSVIYWCPVKMSETSVYKPFQLASDFLSPNTAFQASSTQVFLQKSRQFSRI